MTLFSRSPIFISLHPIHKTKPFWSLLVINEMSRFSGMLVVKHVRIAETLASLSFCSVWSEPSVDSLWQTSRQRFSLSFLAPLIFFICLGWTASSTVGEPWSQVFSQRDSDYGQKPFTKCSNSPVAFIQSSLRPLDRLIFVSKRCLVTTKRWIVSLSAHSCMTYSNLHFGRISAELILILFSLFENCIIKI